MKKYYFLFMMFAVMFAASSLVISCGGDDDNNNGGGEISTNDQKVTSGLVGKWKVVSDYSITDFGKRLEHEPGAIWVFTDETLTIYNEKDLYNGKSVEYTYSDGRIYTSGFPVRNVVELTDTKLVLTCITFAGYDQTVTLQREGSNIQEKEQQQEEQQQEEQQEEVPTLLIGTWEFESNEVGPKTWYIFTKETFFYKIGTMSIPSTYFYKENTIHFFSSYRGNKEDLLIVDKLTLESLYLHRPNEAPNSMKFKRVSN